MTTTHTTPVKGAAWLAALVLTAGCAHNRMALADRAYDRMAYATAACLYEKAINGLEHRDAALRAADAYRRISKLDKAADWYAYAHRIAPLTGADALRQAQVLQSLGRHSEASVLASTLLERTPDAPLAQALKTALEHTAELYADSSLWSVSLVNIPGFAGCFSATPYHGGLIIAGERSAPGSKANPWNGLSFLDLYHVTPDAKGAYTQVKALPGSVNGRFHEGPAALSKDGRTMYFTRSDYYKFRLNKDGSSTSHLKLFRATIDVQRNWVDIHQFAYNGDDYSTGHAALSSDGRTLYLVSDMPEGYGGTDIYRCRWNGEGWDKPENLGPMVNSPGDELFPTLFGDTLFFASNGRGGLGGLDLYRTHPYDDGWALPLNLGFPINTPHDDFSLTMLDGGDSGFLSSNRSGSDRIHAFKALPVVLISEGIFFDEATGQPMAGVEVVLLDLSTGDVQLALTGPDGRYRFELEKGKNYRVSGGKNGMFTESRELSTVGQRHSRTYREDFRLKEVVINKPIVVDNIYYDFDKWDIRADAAVELDKLARLFIDNPDMHFELSSHTDSRATDIYNLVLSEARAKSAVDYLVRKGVDPRRITAKGYGERLPVNHCRDGVECTEEEHQANRRTEFKVTRMERPQP